MIEGSLVLGALVAALYFGRDVFMPLGMAVLLSFALAPLLIRLRRIGVPRIPAVIATVLVMTMALGGVTLLAASQLVGLADNIATYESNLLEKVRSVREAFPSGGVIDRATTALRDLGREIDEATQRQQATSLGATPGGGEATESKPVPVEVHERPPTAIETLRNVLGPMVEPLVTVGLVIVFVVFMLIERTELRDRLIRLIDAQDLGRATRALDDAAKRVSRYLLMQLVIAMAHGIPYGLGLWAIGIPNALLWGLLACALRFVPYLGPVVAAVCPLALAMAVDPGWSMVAMTACLIIALEMMTNNVLEPWLYGSITGLSPVAILVAAVFWATLWGPIGLLLSVPLTTCVVVLGRHVPRLAILDLLLGDRPALTLHERIYQRLLSSDRHEALELVEQFTDQNDFVRLADEVLLPVLRLAEKDRERRALEPAAVEHIASVVDTIGEDLVDIAARATSTAPEPSAPARGNRHVLCVGGRHALDRASAGLLAEAARDVGLTATILALPDLRPGDPGPGGTARVDLVLAAYLTPPSDQQLRRLIRRVRQATAPGTPLVVGIFEPGPMVERAALRPGGDVTATVSSIADAMAAIERTLGLPALPAATPTQARAVSGPLPAASTA